MDRFITSATAVTGRYGVQDTQDNNRLVAYFFQHPTNPDAAKLLADYCTMALNHWNQKQTGGNAQ